MRISDSAIEMIKGFEGCVLHAYNDGTGTLTIGYGHTKNVYDGMVITKEQAEQYLLNDLMVFESHVNSYNDIYNWSQSEFDALVSFAFNIGSIKQLTQNGTRNKQTIAEYMLKYVFAGGVKLDGLVKRRKIEHDLFLSGGISVKSYINEETTLKELVDMIIDGKYGNGEERKNKLYNDIQSLVNERYS